MADGKIKIIQNGPYLVFGGVSLLKETTNYEDDDYPVSWEKVQEYPKLDQYSLCRCGHSKNSPFCDGSHTRVYFDGSEVASREAFLGLAKRCTGKTLDLLDLKNICVLAQFCNRAGGIWELIQNSDRPRARETAIEEACNCPSGRLVLIDKNTGEAIEKSYEPSISVIVEDEYDRLGALWVKGGLSIESSDGYTYEVRNRITLCRCGKSRNKPLCDGSHLFIP